MKRRITTVLNFFAFNLLFFALYLNFVHKDKDVLESLHNTHSLQHGAAFVENGEKLLQKEHSKATVSEGPKEVAKSSVN